MTMKTVNRLFITALALVLLYAGPTLYGQAALTATTLSSAVTTTTAQTIVVASASSVVANYLAIVDNEVMQVKSTWVSGTTIPVTRSTLATNGALHASGAAVTFIPANQVSAMDPLGGPCTSTNEIALPRFVVGANGSRPATVSTYNCSGASTTTQQWVLYTKNGYPAFSFGQGNGAGGVTPVYTGAGAITIMPGIQYIGSGGALAMTLANPTILQNGMVMTIMASTAQAHTVTYTAGFFGTTTSSDVCTMGGAIGDNLVIIANNLTWRAVSTRNCTIA
jgi:hypothetical protein